MALADLFYQAVVEHLLSVLDKHSVPISEGSPRWLQFDTRTS